MFKYLGPLVCRTWWVLLIAWGAVLFGTWYAAPPWEEVAQDREFAFLPEKSPSRRAEKIYAEAFPEDRAGSNIVLVLHRAGTARLKDDLKFIEDVVEPGLRKIAEDEGGLASEPVPSDEPLFGEETKPAAPVKRSIIDRIRTPNAFGAGALLISPDGQATLVVVELTTELLSSSNWPTITKVQNLVRDFEHQGKLPAGLQIAVTGSAVLGRDHTWAELQSAEATGILTVVLVIVLLVLIYRAPLLALIPLLTVYIAVRLSVNVLALLADAGQLTLFEGIQTYITILAYGAGVDYCLFLMARYKEELDKGTPPQHAVCRAVSGVGAALAASAATVICGIGMMIFAEFGKFREAGYAIPLSIFIVFAATLTFSAAVLRLAGRWAFWPQHVGKADEPAQESWWHRVVRPGGLQQAWRSVGQLLLRRPGTVWLVTVALMAPGAIVAGLFYNRLSFDLIGTLPADATSVEGTKVLQQHFPAGIMGPVTVLLVNKDADFSSAHGRAVVQQLTDRLATQRKTLGLADIRSLTAPVGITAAAANAFSGLDVPEEVRKKAIARGSLEHYVTALDTDKDIGTRLELVLAQSPFSQESIRDLSELEHAIVAALPADMRPRTQLYSVGVTPSVRDLANVMQRDRVRIEILVLASVFIILLVLLRRILVTIYLLLSVLFNYYTTLGIAFVVFWLLDPHGFTGIDWKVAIFLFTILIAVGADYNIFLLARIDEEERIHGRVRGVTEALTLTGPIISSCGIIMAGTFASLLAGSLAELRQLGFALAFGVLLDTFVVRPILVPAFLILLHSGRLRLPGWSRTPDLASRGPSGPG